MSAWIHWGACLVLLTTACGRTPPGSFQHTTGGESDDVGDPPDGPGMTSTTGGLSCSPELGTCTVELSLRRAVDILFVIDNSGSMGGEQGTLAKSFASFIEVLEAQQVGANYRIGLTTTDGSGGLRATSCRSRLGEFIFEWEFGSHDERQRGCLDNCEHETLDIPQPWVEKSGGATNLPAGVDMASALQCVGPQGINGPGYEQHLESMRSVLLDESVGFLRTDALLAVIFVTDEADCSMSAENQAWITTQGSVFWTDPSGPTSGSCWLAGVECFGGPGVYDACIAQNKNSSGQPTGNPDAAMLYSLGRYVDTLTQVAAAKQAAGGLGDVMIAVLSGVPLDYPDTDEPLYQDSAFDVFNTEYGIGPGCGRGTETIDDPPGIPPVRLREFAEAFSIGDNNVFSICSDDYGVALESVAEEIGTITERACVAGCVVDEDDTTIGVQPQCDLIQRFPPESGMPDQIVEPCPIIDGTWDFPPDQDICVRVLFDEGNTTPTPVDDLSAQCLTVGSNVELIIERRPDIPVPSGTSVDVLCVLEGEPGVSCDDL